MKDSFSSLKPAALNLYNFCLPIVWPDHMKIKSQTPLGELSPRDSLLSLIASPRHRDKQAEGEEWGFWKLLPGISFSVCLCTRMHVAIHRKKGADQVMGLGSLHLFGMSTCMAL